MVTTPLSVGDAVLSVAEPELTHPGTPPPSQPAALGSPPGYK